MNDKVFTLAVCLLLGACSSVPPEKIPASGQSAQIREESPADAPSLPAPTLSTPAISSHGADKHSKNSTRNSPPVSRNFIAFAQNERTLSVENRARLQGYVIEIKRSPKSIVTLKAFSDNSGSRDYNLATLEQRLRIVSETLQEFGIPKSRIRAVLMGRRTQTSPCATHPCPKALQSIEVLWK